jgi:hypothetical protein
MLYGHRKLRRNIMKLFGLVVLVLGWGLGFWLDCADICEQPVVFWIIGTLGGFFAGFCANED